MWFEPSTLASKIKESWLALLFVQCIMILYR